MLLEYHFARERLARDHDRALVYACRRVVNDYLKVGTIAAYLPLLRAVRRDGYLVPVIGQTEPLLWNWVLVTDEPTSERWPARINPLLEPVVDARADRLPTEPEIALLSAWAQEREISPEGLDMGRLSVGNPGEWARIFDKLGQGAEGPPPIRLAELFEELAGYYLDDRRHDLYLVGYRVVETARLCNDYLVGRAGSYRELVYRDHEVDSAVALLDIARQSSGGVYGHSVFLVSELDERQLYSLDEHRDLLSEHRMIWWVHEALLPRYLDHWPHLRQFFRIMRLEYEIRQDMDRDAIRQDLADLEELYPDSDNAGAMVERLRRVLCYLDDEKSHGR